MPNKNDLLQYLSLLSEFWPTVRSAFRRRTPLEKLNDEEARYRRRYAKGKLTDDRLKTLLDSIDRRRKALAEA